MKNLIRPILILLFSASSLGCQPVVLQKGMVHFDQAFLPVLLHTYEGNLLRAKSAVFFLDFQWQRLQNRYQSVLSEDDNWRETFRRIDEWLGDAYYALDANAPLMALNQLEHVQYEMMALREQYGIDYYPDLLFNFQTSVDVLTETAGDDQLCLLDWQAFERLAAQTTAEWQTIRNQPFDAELYEFDPPRTQELKQYQAEVTLSLQRLREVLACADREEAARACRIIEPALLKVISLFGKDSASQTFFANR